MTQFPWDKNYSCVPHQPQSPGFLKGRKPVTLVSSTMTRRLWVLMEILSYGDTPEGDFVWKTSTPAQSNRWYIWEAVYSAGSRYRQAGSRYQRPLPHSFPVCVSWNWVSHLSWERLCGPPTGPATKP